MTNRDIVSPLLSRPSEDLIAMYQESRMAFAQAYLRARQGPAPSSSGRAPTDDDARHGAEMSFAAVDRVLPDTLLLLLSMRGIHL